MGGGGGGDNQDEFECDNWFVFKKRGGGGIGTLPLIIVGRCAEIGKGGGGSGGGGIGTLPWIIGCDDSGNCVVEFSSLKVSSTF